MTDTSQITPDAVPFEGVTRLDIWKRYWREIKLRAVEHRFYYHQAWEVKEGDLYTTTRYGPMLYRVKEFGVESITAEHLSNDDGQQDCGGNSLADISWGTHEFQSGGFAACRLAIPNWVWEHYAKQDGKTLQS